MANDNNPTYIIFDCMIIRGIEGSNEKGTISYSVGPNKRRKHYGAHVIKLLLEKCGELAIK